jgi:predicted nucleic acid-binding protein
LRGTLVDTNVLLDIFTEDSVWCEWSSKQIDACSLIGPIFVNPIIYAEVSVGFDDIESLEAAMPPEDFTKLDLPYEAAFLAAKAFLDYKKRGGSKKVTLPDFFIGAHAAVLDLRLLTRDSARFRTYFPTVKLIAP